ncbi:MAG: UbiX family flavin prenyltransferase [Parachlamydiales bacterium]|nr:UbiX family flavin prenyltransferase [Parachlamydiales bacterium]
MARIVVGVSGASGIILAKHAVNALANADYDVDLVLSKPALLTASIELGASFGTLSGFVSHFNEDVQKKLTIHRIGNFSATIASGSYHTDGMLIIPCSMGTLAGIALGLCDNLIKRSADVTLKERRRLVIVPRESPLSEIHLEHMLKLTRMGAVMIPPVPGWYTHHRTLLDVEKFIVGKALDLLDVKHDLYTRWDKDSVTHVEPFANIIALASS